MASELSSEGNHMQIKGVKIQPPKPFDIILPREGSDPIHLKVQAVLDEDEFEKLVKEPTPPQTFKPGDSVGKPDHDDPTYKAEWRKWWDKQQGWLALKSLSATEGLTFDTMSLDKPDTCSFMGLMAEFKSAGLLDNEVQYIVKQIRRANASDESHIEEARKRFLLQVATQKP